MEAIRVRSRIISRILKSIKMDDVATCVSPPAGGWVMGWVMGWMVAVVMGWMVAVVMGWVMAVVIGWMMAVVIGWDLVQGVGIANFDSIFFSSVAPSQ